MIEFYNPVGPDGLDPVDRYLHVQAEEDAELAGLLSVALKRSLSKRKENLSPLKELPQDAPAWLVKKWTKKNFIIFDADKDATLKDKIRQIADWLGAALVEQEKTHPDESSAWLKKVDEKNRPKKLLKLGSLEQALAEAGKSMSLSAMKLKQGHGYDADVEITEVVKIFDDNKHVILRLKNAAALDYESVTMEHCVGHGKYDRKVVKEQIDIFSLRDENNKPQATFEVEKKSNLLKQCKGYSNAAPKKEHLPFIQQFIKENGFDLDTTFGETGLIKVDSVYYRPDELPDGLIVDRKSFDISDVDDFIFPKNLRVRGVLHVGMNQLWACLNAEGLMAKEINCTHADLSGQDYVQFPENLICNNLILNGNLYDPTEGTLLKKHLKSTYLEYVFKNGEGKFHRDAGPALIAYVDRSDEGDIYECLKQMWYSNGLEHRMDGPSYLYTALDYNVVQMERWRQNGIYQRNDGGATDTCRDLYTGRMTEERYELDGQMYLKRRYNRLGEIDHEECLDESGNTVEDGARMKATIKLAL